MIANIFGILFLILVTCFIVTISMNHYAAEHIDRYWDHYSNYLNTLGMNLNNVSYGDSSPCESKFQILGNDVRITKRPFTLMKLLKKIRGQKITLTQLREMSDTPFSKVPKF